MYHPPPPPQVALKCADLGHLSTARGTHQRWVTLLEEEMFRQGDRERAAGQPVSALMDRTKTGITKSQVGGRMCVCSHLVSAENPSTHVRVRVQSWLKTQARMPCMRALVCMSAHACPSNYGTLGAGSLPCLHV